jgi:transcription antitermination factor NusG
VWFTEALFPSYFFARFELAADLPSVCHARGVRGVVHFGHRWPVIPDRVVEEMRATVGPDQVHVIREDLQPGETVEIAGGAFHGLRALVTRVMPSQKRAAVLLEFLGQQTTVELSLESIIREGGGRKSIL